MNVYLLYARKIQDYAPDDITLLGIYEAEADAEYWKKHQEINAYLNSIYSYYYIEKRVLIPQKS
jgi:hypothetical protein